MRCKAGGRRRSDELLCIFEVGAREGAGAEAFVGLQQPATRAYTRRAITQPGLAYANNEGDLTLKTDLGLDFSSTMRYKTLWRIPWLLSSTSLLAR